VMALLREKSGKSILVRTKESTVKLNFDSIRYAILSHRVIIYCLTNDKTVESTQLRASFSEVVRDLLNDRRFYRAGASVVVNFDHITEIGADYAVFKGGVRLSFGRKAIRDIRSAWCEFCLNEVKSI